LNYCEAKPLKNTNAAKGNFGVPLVSITSIGFDKTNYPNRRKNETQSQLDPDHLPDRIKESEVKLDSAGWPANAWRQLLV
jgi:hypothetical protein